MPITTKRGDKGFTDLLSGGKVPKYDLRVVACGIIDEANSMMGIAKASCQNPVLKRVIDRWQKELFIVGAELSACPYPPKGLKERLTQSHLEGLEESIRCLEDTLRVPSGFIIPGTTLTSAFLDMARALVRKAERVATRLRHKGTLGNDYVTLYLNRLSDLLYLLARYETVLGSERSTQGKGAPMDKIGKGG